MILSEDSSSTSKATGPEVQKEQAIIHGTVTYPWGTIRDAKIAIGEKAVVSDGTGGYELSGLTPGPHNITAEAPFPGYETASLKVEVAAGETKTVDIYLDFKKAVVDGYVHDKDGKPIAGATLSGVLSGKDMDDATTDERGYFRFQRVTPGDRFIRVNARGYMGETRDFAAKENSATTLEFRLTPAACKVHGMISDATGKPVPAEMLLLKSGIVVQKTTSNAETGYYEFPILPGIYEIIPMAYGYQPRSWHGSISTDTKVDFKLETAPQVQE